MHILFKVSGITLYWAGAWLCLQWCFKINLFIIFGSKCGKWADIKRGWGKLNVFRPNEFWASLFFHEKGQGHFRLFVCSWEGETNCLNVSSCETIRLQGCCQGCFWHLAQSLRAIPLFLEIVELTQTCSQ